MEKVSPELLGDFHRMENVRRSCWETFIGWRKFVGVAGRLPSDGESSAERALIFSGIFDSIEN
jgi:hypothetical protein